MQTMSTLVSLKNIIIAVILLVAILAGVFAYIVIEDVRAGIIARQLLNEEVCIIDEGPSQLPKIDVPYIRGKILPVCPNIKEPGRRYDVNDVTSKGVNASDFRIHPLYFSLDAHLRPKSSEEVETVLVFSDTKFELYKIFTKDRLVQEYRKSFRSSKDALAHLKQLAQNCPSLLQNESKYVAIANGKLPGLSRSIPGMRRLVIVESKGISRHHYKYQDTITAVDDGDVEFIAMITHDKALFDTKKFSLFGLGQHEFDVDRYVNVIQLKVVRRETGAEIFTESIQGAPASSFKSVGGSAGPLAGLEIPDEDIGRLISKAHGKAIVVHK